MCASEALLLVGAASLLSCHHDEDPDAPPRLALEAWIDSDGYPVALLTRAISPADQAVDLADVMVRWGRVTISDGTDSVVMTGGVDHSVFPPYSYRTFAMRGRVGDTYTVTADYHGSEIRATASILPPPVIEGVEFAHISDSLCGATLTFTAPASADTARYVVFTRVRGRESRHYPAYLGVVSSYSPAQRCRVPLYRGIHTGNRNPFEANFVLGDTVDIILARVEPRVFAFWQGYHDEVYFGHNIFVSTAASPVGNVEGGYGVFSARGVARTAAVVAL